MTIPTITPFTNIPSITDPTNFAAEGEDFLGNQLPARVAEMNAAGVAIDALAAQVTSTVAGGGFTIPYNFAASTSGNPGTGAAALNNATQASAATLRLNLTDSAGATQTTKLDALDDSTSTTKGRFRLTKISNGAWLDGDLTVVTTQTGYRDLTISNVSVSAANPFTAGDALLFTFSPKGDKGDTGATGAVTLTGTATGAINWNTAQTIASATTTDIGAATSNYVIVSGTTTITGLGTIAQGAERIVRFSGALTLTYNATSLILPGSASITTAAGDVGRFVSEGSGNWRCINYSKANGTSVVVAGVSGNVPLSTLTASSSATLSDTTNITSAYDAYEIIFEDLLAASASQELWMRVTTDAGSSWMTSGYSLQHTHSYTTTVTSSSATPAALVLTDGGGFMPQTGYVGLSGRMLFLNPNSVGGYKKAMWHLGYGDSFLRNLTAVGLVNSSNPSQTINGLQFLISSGNIASGKIHINGIKFA